MLEPFIDGINISAPIIEGIETEHLAIFTESEDNPQNIITFEGKRNIAGRYSSKLYQGPLTQSIQQYTKRIERELRPYDYGRLDFRCDNKTNTAYLIDANLICNASRGSVVAKAAKAIGADHRTLIEHILATSLQRQISKFRPDDALK